MVKRSDKAIQNAPLRRLMKKAGAQIVSKDALNALSDNLSSKVAKCTEATVSMNKIYKKSKVQKNQFDLVVDKKWC